MRLTKAEQVAIRTAAVQAFGSEAVVRLFGSRLDDTQRGGDIDLFVQLPARPGPSAAAAFRVMLNRYVGEREYDILIATGERPASAVERRALAEGVIL